MIVVYAPREVASDLFDRVPRLSRDLGEVMELRRRAIALARQAGSPQLLA